MSDYHPSAYVYIPWRRVFPSTRPRTTQMLVESANPRMPVLFGGSGVLVRCSIPHIHRTNDDLRGVWVDCTVASAVPSITLEYRKPDSHNGRRFTGEAFKMKTRADLWGIEHDSVMCVATNAANNPEWLWTLKEWTHKPARYRHNDVPIAIVGTKAAITSFAYDHGLAASPCVVLNGTAKRYELDPTLADLQYDYKLAMLFNR